MKHVRTTPLRRLADNVKPIRNYVVVGAAVAAVGGLIGPGMVANAATTLGIGAVHNKNIAYHAVTDSKVNYKAIGFPKLSAYTQGRINAAYQAGVRSFSIDGNGVLWAVRPDGTKQNLGEVVGAAGKDGAPGKDGKDGVSGYEVDGFYTLGDGADQAGQPIAGNAKWAVRTAHCADGKYAVGGGGSGTGGADDTGTKDSTLIAKASYPSGVKAIDGDPEGSARATSWSVAFENTGDAEQVGRVYVVCAALN